MTAKFETYLAIVKINAKQLINAMNIATKTNNKKMLYDTLNDVISNVLDFIIPNNLLMGDVIEFVSDDDPIYEMYLKYELCLDDFVPHEWIGANNWIDPKIYENYLLSLKSECMEHFDEWLQYGKLSINSYDSLLIDVFGEYTTSNYIWKDKSLMETK